MNQRLGCEYSGAGTLLNPKGYHLQRSFCVRYYLDSNFVMNDINLSHNALSTDPNAYWYDDDNGWRQ